MYMYYTFWYTPSVFPYHASIKYFTLLNTAKFNTLTCLCLVLDNYISDAWRSYLCMTMLWIIANCNTLKFNCIAMLKKNLMHYNQIIHSLYNMGAAYHSHACIFTCIWLVIYLCEFLKYLPILTTPATSITYIVVCRLFWKGHYNFDYTHAYWFYKDTYFYKQCS